MKTVIIDNKLQIVFQGRIIACYGVWTMEIARADQGNWQFRKIRKKGFFMYKCGQRKKGLFCIFLIAMVFYQIFVTHFYHNANFSM